MTEWHLWHDAVFSSSRHPNKPLCSTFLRTRNTTASLNMINLPQGINRYSNFRHFTAEEEDKDTDGSHSTQSSEGDGNLCCKSKCCSSIITGPFTALFPSFHLLSQRQEDTEQTVEMTEHHSNHQSVVEPENSRQAHGHNSPSPTSSACLVSTAKAKKSLLVQPTPSSCQEQPSTQIPSNCTATRQKICRTAAPYTTNWLILCV